ncbi:HAD family hydrolase [Leptolyngbyaceae cyanobacterium CCMR0082]|uniref:HAD family hydrolase n=2 Tax=Adonisia turfae TaxID=2950184 RepID=A0A6M0S7R7_9CYAN|nr:HAD-IA family hydrolase [Adonisia turfae]MDV3348576.1 HAD-IA family hydrolase [Leptothoe sp. LEGE 181152]NEZ56569.1 HAD family hydrolase [Adonisia turfae CCMR0081]NEZ64528.1 HAD family hydrolase [Adonisia turfae CCMR0082]
MLKAVLFDLDGTLANTDPIHFQVWQTLLASHDMVVDQEFYDRFISGRLNPDIVQDLLPQLSVEAGVAFIADKEAQFREMAANQLQRMPGLTDFLHSIEQKGYAIALVTNAPRPNAEFMLKTLALNGVFDPIVIADDLPKGKPDPLPYQTALEQLRLLPDEAIVFEDSPTGVQAATAAGIPTIGVTSTHSDTILCQLGAQCTIADFTDSRLLAYVGDPDVAGTASR